MPCVRKSAGLRPAIQPRSGQQAVSQAVKTSSFASIISATLIIRGGQRQSQHLGSCQEATLLTCSSGPGLLPGQAQAGHTPARAKPPSSPAPGINRPQICASMSPRQPQGSCMWLPKPYRAGLFSGVLAQGAEPESWRCRFQLDFRTGIGLQAACFQCQCACSNHVLRP